MRRPRREPSGASITEFFRAFAKHIADFVGSPWAFAAAVGLVLVWAATGRYFHYSDTWQLVINTGTTIVTFLMVFLMQNTQNRDAKAIHLKLDELLRGVKHARTGLVHLEDLSESELADLAKEFEDLQHARRSKRRRTEPVSSAGGDDD